MERHALEVVRWRIGYRALTLDLFAYFLACAGMLFYFSIAPVLTLSGIAIVGVFAIVAVRRNNRIVGVVCTLNYCVDEARFTTFVSDDKNVARNLIRVNMLWRSSYCSLIRIECSNETNASWKQWIYAAETTPECYRCLLRVLR